MLCFSLPWSKNCQLTKSSREDQGSIEHKKKKKDKNWKSPNFSCPHKIKDPASAFQHKLLQEKVMDDTYLSFIVEENGGYYFGLSLHIYGVSNSSFHNVVKITAVKPLFKKRDQDHMKNWELVSALFKDILKLSA